MVNMRHYAKRLTIKLISQSHIFKIYIKKNLKFFSAFTELTIVVFLFILFFFIIIILSDDANERFIDFLLVSDLPRFTTETVVLNQMLNELMYGTNI